MSSISVTLLIHSFLLSLIVGSGKTDDFRVELVQILFRHGERTPLKKELYPKDPHDVCTYEPWGIGQLTNQGKLREYKIGLMLRKRYSKFLNDVYFPRDVYAVSTDVDRTKMSLQLLLAGLYPPASTQIWNSHLLWLAIPTHYAPVTLDILLRSHETEAYKQAFKEVKALKEVRDITAKFQNLFDLMSPKTGLNITDLTQVYEIHNLIVSQKSMNLSIPAWVTEDVFKQMQKAVNWEYHIRTYTKKLKQLHSGMLIKQIIENMNLIGQNNSTRKIYLYSAHEVNLAAYIRSHNLSEPQLPAYGSAIIVEKLRDNKGKVYVRMLWWSGVTEKLNTYKLEGCEEICPAETYVKMMSDIFPSSKEIDSFWDRITKDDLKQLYVDKHRYD